MLSSGIGHINQHICDISMKCVCMFFWPQNDIGPKMLKIGPDFWLQIFVNISLVNKIVRMMLERISFETSKEGLSSDATERFILSLMILGSIQGLE